MDRRGMTLRLWMGIIVAAALVLSWIRSQDSFGHALAAVSHSSVARSLCFAATLGMAQKFGPVILGRRRRAALAGLVGLALIASAYSGWAHYRCLHLYLSGLDHGFPYPDPAINALERWFDARRPVVPGNLKLHGEYPSVGFVLGLLALGLISSSGVLLGVLSNRAATLPHSRRQPCEGQPRRW